MTHCCSQCNFTAQFESALRMHHQLHHEAPDLNGYKESNSPKLLTDKSNTIPRGGLDASFSSNKESKGFKLAARTSSATRLLDKLRSRITRSRSRMLFAHPEEASDSIIHTNDLSISSDCTSKALDLNPSSKCSAITASLTENKETYGCHLCSFDADRITVLDRHLLNDHKIGLENLLKLVLAKTKDGLSEDGPNPSIYGIRQTYYRPANEIIEEGEFVIETVTPKIKILKHASTNTDIQWSDIPDLKDNCRMITKELEKLMQYPTEKSDKNELLAKMQTLNECMSKFVDSTNTIKRVLTKEYDSKSSVRERLSTAEPFFDLGLGDQDTPRDWERAHSEKMERSRHKYGDSSRGSKPKFFSESFYF